METAADFEQVKRQVLESAKRLLRGRTDEHPLTHAEIASDTGLEIPVVLRALQSLAGGQLDVKPLEDWARAEVHGLVQEE